MCDVCVRVGGWQGDTGLAHNCSSHFILRRTWAGGALFPVANTIFSERVSPAQEDTSLSLSLPPSLSLSLSLSLTRPASPSPRSTNLRVFLELPPQDGLAIRTFLFDVFRIHFELKHLHWVCVCVCVCARARTSERGRAMSFNS